MACKNNKKVVLVKYKIIDEKGKILVNDYKKNFRLDIHKHKLEKPFLTYDNRYFINPNSNKLTVEESDDDKIIKFDIKKLKKYNIVKLMDLVYTIGVSDKKFKKEINKYDIVIDDGKDKDAYKKTVLSNKKIVLSKDNNIKRLYTIFDKNGNVLVNDAIENCKFVMNGHLLKKEAISFDNKHFFNSNSKNLIIKKSNDNNIIPFDINKFSAYNIISLRELKYVLNVSDAVFNKEIRKYDIIFDYDIKGIDSQVKKLVDALNNCGLKIETQGSCSGHNVVPPWISIKFKDCESLKNIIYLIDYKYNGKLIFTTKNIVYGLHLNNIYKKNKGLNFKDLNLVFVLTTELIGIKAYKLFNDFAKEILVHKKSWLKFDNGKEN